MVNKYLRCFLPAYFLFFNLAFAQNPGPAGIGTGDGSEGPRSVLWLKADEGVTADGSNRISAWADQSGNGLNAAQATGALQPLLIPSSDLNSRAAIRFSPTGNNIHLAIPNSNLLDDGANLTFFIAVNTGTSTGARGILSKRNNLNNNQSYLIWRDGNNITSRMGESANVSLGGADGNTNLLINVTYDGTLPGNKNFIRLNSTNQNSGNGPNSIGANASNLHIGTFDTSAGENRNFAGDIAEVIVYKSSLNASQRIIIENYLSEKYGLSIGSNDFFGNAPMFDPSYFEDFRGIGSADGSVKVSSTVDDSDGMGIEEFSGSFNSAGDFVMYAHDGTAHGTTTDNINPTDIDDNRINLRWSREWYVENSGNNSVQITFDFDADASLDIADFNPPVLLYRGGTGDDFNRMVVESASIDGNRVVFQVAANRFTSGFYTLGTGEPSTAQTWYVFQDGEWDEPLTWTLDASTAPIFNNPLNSTPGPDDQVIIRSGKFVSIPTGLNNLQLNGLEVRGRINLRNTTGHNFLQINGNGFIELRGHNPGSGLVENFPVGNTSGSIGFGNPENGGTLVVRGAGPLTLNSNRSFRNVRIDMSGLTDQVSLGADWTISGDLTVRNGTFYFGDGSTTARNLNVVGNVLVEDNGSTRRGRIRVNTADAFHRMEIGGNFINDGSVHFTNRSDFPSQADRENPNYTFYQNASTQGRVEVVFNNDQQDQQVSLNNTTRFYRLVVNKGTDDTYSLNLETVDPTHFQLVGPANNGMSDNDVSQESDNSNAFALIFGNASIGTNVNLWVLNRGGNYNIGTGARLTINGGLVRKSAGEAIVPYGTIELNAGQLLAPITSGITLRGNGNFIVNGGTAEIRAFRTSVFGSDQLGAYQQSGGNVTITGGAVNNNYAVFSLTYPGNVFLMSGGNLTIRGRNNLGSGSERGVVFINSDPGNQSVTGGTVVFESNTTTAYRITSRAPFHNVRMRNTVANAGNIVLRGTTSGQGGGDGTQTLDIRPLRVLRDYTLETGVIRTSGPNSYGTLFETNGAELAVGRNFTLEDQAVLDLWSGNPNNEGSSTVRFTSSQNATLFIGDITTYDVSLTGFIDPESEQSYRRWEHPFYRLIINKPNATLALSAKDPGRGVEPTAGNLSTFKNPDGGKNVRSFATNLIKVVQSFRIDNGTFDQMDPRNPIDGQIYAYSLRLYVNDVSINGTLFTYEDGVSPKEANVRFRLNAGVINLSATPESSIGNVRVNLGGVATQTDTLKLLTNVYVKRLEYRHGKVNMGVHNLKIDVLDINMPNSPEVNTAAGTRPVFDNNNIFLLTGNASDGGLSLKWPRNVNVNYPEYWVNNSGYNQNRLLWFPLGPDREVGNSALNVGIVYFHDDPASFNGEGYITLNISESKLATLNPDETSGDRLDLYWRVRYEGFEEGLPQVSHVFQYQGSQELGNPANYLPGSVLDSNPYTRSTQDGSNIKVGGSTGANGQLLGNNPRNILVFNDGVTTISGRFIENNGTINWANFTSAPGIELANANFTAGAEGFFDGVVRVLYTRLPGGSDWYNRNWQDGNHWSEVPHDGATNNNDRPAAGFWPGAGDVAVIGYGGYGGSGTIRHSINIASANNIEVAEIIFDNPFPPLGDNPYNGSRLVVNGNGTLSFGKILGSDSTNFAQIMLRFNNSQNPTVTGDFGEFNSRESFYFAYFLQGGGTFSLDPPTTLFPNLRIESGSPVSIIRDIVVNQSFLIDGNAVFRTHNGAAGDIEVKGDLILGGWQGGTLEFNSGTERKVEVGGILMERNGGTGNSNIRVRNNVTNGLRHRFILNGDINITNGGSIDLFTSLDPLDNNVILEFSGEGAHSISQSDGEIPEFYQFVMNKGEDTDQSFSIPVPFTIPDATSDFQPVEFLNGLLVLDTDDINGETSILLANGSSLPIPNTNNPLASSGSAGLELLNGEARIRGANTGILLDGLLKIDGGSLDMDGGAGVNNFIEYSSTGNAEIEVLDGELIVGSQVRRSLTSTTGILKYRQTGGNVIIAKNATPATSRAAFEVTNSGSEFVHTGGDLTIVRHVNSGTTPTLRITPDSHSIDNTTIFIGNDDTPTNQNNFGIRANIPLNRLEINGSNMPMARLYTVPLEVNELFVGGGNSFSANGFDLTIQNLLQNEGDFEAGGNSTNNQITFFPSTSQSDILGSGSTEFYNLYKENGGELLIEKEITVLNELRVLDGVFNTSSVPVNVKRDMIHNAIQVNANGAPGILFNGTQEQKLRRLDAGISEFGTVNLNNAAGLIIEPTGHDFIINEKMVLSAGVFDVGGNLITFPENARIENASGGTSVSDFNVNRMIQTNSSIRDFGVRKIFPAIASGSETFTFPVGLTSYTPVVINIEDISASSLTVRPVSDIAPIDIGSPLDPDCEDNDLNLEALVGDEDNNVLAYYWILRSQGMTDFNGSVQLFYNPADIRINTSEFSIAQNYGPARLADEDDSWDKVYSTGNFSTSPNRIDFPINGDNDDSFSGIYTAGVTLKNVSELLCKAAIPDNVPQFVTLEAVQTGNYNVGGSYIDGVAPNPGITPDVTIQSGFTLRYNSNFLRARRITIEEGATLEVPSGVIGLNLGTVRGQGTIRLVSDGSSVSFPAGDYSSFFPGTNCVGGGGLEFAGTGTYSIMEDIPTIRRVILSGSGTRTLPVNNTLTICENLEVLGSVQLIIPDNNNTVRIRGNFFKSDMASFDNGGSNSRIVMQGSAQQLISGDFTGASSLPSLDILNSNNVSIINNADAGRGISAGGDVRVAGNFQFIVGRIITNDANSLIIGNNGGISGFTTTRYVQGPLKRELGPSATANSTFPVGTVTRNGRMEVRTPGGYAGLKTWDVRYFNASADAIGPIEDVNPSDDIIAVSGNEYWRIEVASTATANLRLFWDNFSFDEGDINDIRIARWDGTQDWWTELNTVGGPNGNINAGDLIGGPISFSTQFVTFGTTDEDTTLPVELVFFKASLKDQAVRLDWQTASETNNDYFEIQRSLDGRTFEYIGEVEGNGTTYETIDYYFYDEQPLAGKVYYRLKQVDFDGSFEYSDIVMIETHFDLKVAVYPNPTQRGDINVMLSGMKEHREVDVQIISLNGVLIYNQKIDTRKLATDPLPIQQHIASGVYLLRIVMDNQQIHNRVIIH